MFSLDDETLEAGGESILASKGDLGQLLFSASAGLADLSRTLVDLRAEADGFYKYRARSGELPALKAELAALKDERERIDTFASEYAQLVATHDRAAAQYDEAIAERGLIRARMDEIQRHLNALPRSAALRSIRERIAAARWPSGRTAWLDRGSAEIAGGGDRACNAGGRRCGRDQADIGRARGDRRRSKRRCGSRDGSTSLPGFAPAM